MVKYFSDFGVPTLPQSISSILLELVISSDSSNCSVRARESEMSD